MSIFHSDGNITKFTVYKSFQFVGMTFSLAFCLNRTQDKIANIVFKTCKKNPQSCKTLIDCMLELEFCVSQYGILTASTTKYVYCINSHRPLIFN